MRITWSLSQMMSHVSISTRDVRLASSICFQRCTVHFTLTYVFDSDVDNPIMSFNLDSARDKSLVRPRHLGPTLSRHSFRRLACFRLVDCLVVHTSYLLTATWIQSEGLDYFLVIHIVDERALLFIAIPRASIQTLGRAKSPRLEYLPDRR